jgi:C-terminal processing protease CtpA/Prc
MEKSELKGDFFGGLVYGKFGSASNVGSIQMVGLSYEDNDMTLDDYEAQLNIVFEELGSCDSIVIDHRFNTGGEDSAALLLASYFASERTLAYTQTAVNGDTFTENHEVYINPAPEEFRFHGKVVLIVSEEDASAGETFALSMKQLPQTTIVGRNTAGISPI